jgi:hypothetical protein
MKRSAAIPPVLALGLLISAAIQKHDDTPCGNPEQVTYHQIAH